ncbi:hypothetical protein TIFTF001_027875 [Ficus carica]|uniref:Uncharacterized protein n=1 Tax=Ficus carica TaxID=3494 RepID=A0AA88DQ15_FICCA|nr:hypothetical protein TIFTF001_027875 [Ficus carica]
MIPGAQGGFPGSRVRICIVEKPSRSGGGGGRRKRKRKMGSVWCGGWVLCRHRRKLSEVAEDMNLGASAHVCWRRRRPNEGVDEGDGSRWGRMAHGEGRRRRLTVGAMTLALLLQTSMSGSAGFSAGGLRI